MKIKITKATPEDFEPYIPKNDEDRFGILQRLIHSDIDFKFDDFNNKFILNSPIQRPKKGNTLLEKNIENVENKLIESNPIFDSIKKNVLDNHREQLGEFEKLIKTTPNELRDVIDVLHPSISFSTFDYSPFIRTFIENGFKDDYLNPELEIYNHKENIAVVAPYHLVFYNELIDFLTNVRIWYFLNRLEISLDESLQPAKNEIKPDEEEPTKFSIDAKHYTLAYILDCKAKGEKPISGKKKKLESIFEKNYLKDVEKPKPNTCYKLTSELENKLESLIIHMEEDFGDNWKEIVLSLSFDRESLQAYIKTKYNK